MALHFGILPTELHPEQVKDYLFEQGYDEKNGARPLKRAIQKFIEDKLTDAIINEEIKVGDKISLKYEKNNSEVKLTKLTSKNKEKKENDIEPENSLSGQTVV